MNDLTSSLAHDTLSDLLHAVRFTGSILCKSSLRAPWGFSVEGRDFAGFHYVVRGSCWLDVSGSARRQLARGDLVVLPHGSSHVVRDAPGSIATRLEKLVAGGTMDGLGNLRAGGRGRETVLVCGGFHCDDRATHPILRSLPAVLHLRGRNRAAGWLHTTLRYLARESGSGAPGADTVIARLADIVFVEVVRAYLTSTEGRDNALAAALRDRQLGAVLVAVHRQPEAPWDLGSLAKTAGMSRTVFAARFRRVMGATPLQYVTARRMDKARGLLRDTAASIAEVAAAVGYDTQVGFHRAFKRHARVAPATWRSRARARS
jgi:AraC-like DNA-binding protein